MSNSSNLFANECFPPNVWKTVNRMRVCVPPTTPEPIPTPPPAVSPRRFGRVGPRLPPRTTPLSSVAIAQALQDAQQRNLPPAVLSSLQRQYDLAVQSEQVGTTTTPSPSGTAVPTSASSSNTLRQLGVVLLLTSPAWLTFMLLRRS